MDRHITAAGLGRLLASWRGPGRRAAYAALADRIRLLMLDGRLPLHTRLPAERELAAALGVSRTTIAAAYDRLRAEGFLRSRQGSGSWTTLPEGPARDAGAERFLPFAPHGYSAALDLAHAALAAPTEAMTAAVARAVEVLPSYLPQHGYHLAGLDPLRAAVAARYTARGLPTSPEQVLVTAGAQQGFVLTLRALAGPGDRVLVEHPTYPNALDAVRRVPARPVPVPLHAEGGGNAGGWDTGGWDTAMLAATLRDAAPRLAYLVVDHHNPTGLVMDAATRAEVVDLARRTRTPLVVDETLAELTLEGSAPPPLATFAGETLPVITLGSASKTFWGGLRIGWLRAPRPLVRALAAARASLDLASPVFDQLVVTELLGGVEDVLASRRVELRAARDLLLDALAAALPHWRPNRPTGGLCLWVDLGAPVSSALVSAAARHDVALAAGPRFGLDGAFERFLRLPYTLPADRLGQAVERLAVAWAGLAAAAIGEAEPAQVV